MVAEDGAAFGQARHALLLERGVRHGALALMPVEPEADQNSHDGTEAHAHLRVQETF